MEVINEQKRNYENDSIDELIHPVGYSSCQTLSIVAYVNAQSFIGEYAHVDVSIYIFKPASTRWIMKTQAEKMPIHKT
ncbi:unnamed protein product [Rotaria socialis]